jgi:uncharacterized protein
MYNSIANFITYTLFKLEEGTQQAEAVHFFFYDSIKILILIFTVVSVIAFIRTFISASKLQKTMSKARFGLGNIAASLLGAVTPFCSCSSIPLFLGFIKARIPLGIAFSFLITSPLVNEVAFVIMGGLFGWHLAFLYALTGILLGVFAGIFLGKMQMEKHLILEKGEAHNINDENPKQLVPKLKFALKEGKRTIKKLFPYVLGGVAIGALIHGFVPQEFFTNTVGKYSIFSVPIAVIIGVPIYAGCSTVVPLIFSITANGIPLGTSLALMMSIAGLSLPEAVILKRVMNIKLLATFFATVAVGIVIIGYLFNLLA